MTLHFFEKAILLPGPDHRCGERFDYVVCRPDYLGRVDFDNKISRGFVIKVNNGILKTQFQRTKHLSSWQVLFLLHKSLHFHLCKAQNFSGFVLKTAFSSATTWEQQRNTNKILSKKFSKDRWFFLSKIPNQWKGFLKLTVKIYFSKNFKMHFQNPLINRS